MAKRHFLITKKALASYLHVSRNTIASLFKKYGIDIKDMNQVLDWLMLEGWEIKEKKGVDPHRTEKSECLSCGVTPGEIHKKYCATYMCKHCGGNKIIRNHAFYCLL